MSDEAIDQLIEAAATEIAKALTAARDQGYNEGIEAAVGVCAGLATVHYFAGVVGNEIRALKGPTDE